MKTVALAVLFVVDNGLDIQRKLTWFTGALAVVAAFQLIAMIWQGCVLWKTLGAVKHQAHEMKRQRVTMHGQLKAMQGQLSEMGEQTAVLEESVAHAAKAAEAALLNAQAVINAERPWVMIQINKHIHTNNSTADFEIVAFNYGRTPARIISCKGARKSACIIPDQELTIPPDYGAGILWNERFLAPRDSFTIDSVDPYDVANELLVAGEAGKRGLSNGIRLVIYGQIRYDDGISGKLHETRWCYMHRGAHEFGYEIGGQMILCGPREYNLYT